MCNAAIVWAYQTPVGRACDKFVLVTLANYANPDGTCFPSQSRLIADTELDRKTIIAALKRLTDAGLLIDTGYRKGTTKSIPVYRLPVPATEAVPNIPEKAVPYIPVAQPEAVPDIPPSSPIFPTKQSHISAEAVPNTGHRTPKEPSKEPPLNHQVPSSSRGTRLPADWQPNAHLRAYARDHGLDPDKTLVEFRDWYLSAPGQKGVWLRWDLVWQRWCRNQNQRNQEPRFNGHRQPVPDRTGYLLDLMGKRPPERPGYDIDLTAEPGA